MDMTGSTLLHYEIEERLGEGGMGVVYRATDTKLGRKVALKFLPAFVSQRQEEKERFLREARTASGLDHPNIATIYEVNEVDDKVFYAMTLVEGVTLKDLRRGGPVTHKQIIQIAIQVADGLTHAHEHDVVHRDIKPQNIMVTGEGRALILDFGLAKVGMQESVSGSSATSGTAAYLSPEQAQGDPATPQSDLWGLGVVLYELLAGDAPFKGDHPAALMYSIVHEEPEPLKNLAGDTPPPLLAIVERLMAKDQKKRFESAAELSTELRQLARDLEYSSYSGQVRTIKKEAHLSWRSVALAGVAVLALGWFASSLMTGTSKDPKANDQYDVAVMYFDDLTGHGESKRTGKIVSELLTTGLSGAADLRVLSSQRLYDILKQVGDAEGTVIDQSVATEIAMRAGARHMVTGTIASSGDRTRLMANLIDVSSGRVVRAEQVEGGDLFAMVDSVCARLHDNIAPVLADATPTQQLSVADVTTSSVEAYRLYSEGLDYYHKLDWDPAIARFDSAIALDSNFALAYLRAAIAAFSSNRASQGFQYVGYGRDALEDGSLPERERMLVSAFTNLADNNIRGAVEQFEDLAKAYPDDKEAYFWMGTFQWQSGDARDGIASLRRSLDLDPEYSFALINLAEAYRDLDDIPNAISVTERYVALQPDEATPRLELSGLYIRLKQFDKARSILAEASALDPGQYRVAASLASYYARRGWVDSIQGVLEPFMADSAKITDRTAARDLWASALFLNGRFGESFAMYRATAELQRQQGDSIAVSGHLIATAARHLAIGETDSAQMAFDEAYDINPENLRFSDLPYRIALAQADTLRAATIREKLWERYAKAATEDQLKRAEIAFTAQAAWYEADYSNVLTHLNNLRRVSGDPDDYSYMVGVAQLETGQADSARIELDRSLVRYNPFNAQAYWVHSWYQLGRTHEALGNRGDAVTAYRTFLKYWGRTDRPIPEVQRARERIRELANAS